MLDVSAAYTAAIKEKVRTIVLQALLSFAAAKR